MHTDVLCKLAERCKRADAISDMMAQLETLRQSKVMQNTFARQSAGQGGLAAGGQMGAAAGGLGALGGIFKLLLSKKLGAGGRLGLGAATAAAGAGLGAGLGGRAGRFLGERSVPKLPASLSSPVSLATVPQVTSDLSKAAGINLGGIANFFGSGFRGAAHAAAPAARAALRPTARALGVTGALGAGGAVGARALGYGQEAAQTTVGRTPNPATWLNPQSEQQVFDNSSRQYREMEAGQHRQIANAWLGENPDHALDLQAKPESGNFGGSPSHWYNPASWFGAQPSAGQHLSAVHGIQDATRARHSQLQAFLQSYGGTMPMTTREQLQQQVEKLRQRFSTPVGPQAGTPPAPAGPTAAAGYPAGDWRHGDPALYQRGGIYGYS